MTNCRRLVSRIALSILAALPVLLFARSILGPAPGHTGAPGDQLCTRAGCHAGTANTGPGRVGIAFPAGQRYLPGVRQWWQVTITDPDAQRFGFQATARQSANPELAQAGRFEPFDGTTFVLCQDGSERAAGACPAATPVEFIEHNDRYGFNTFLIEWTPPDTPAGDVKVYIAANAADGRGTPSGDRIYTAEYTLSPLAFPSAPRINGVSQAFDNSARLSSGTYIQIFGENLSAVTRSWNPGDFTPKGSPPPPGARGPNALDQARVLVNGKDAFVSYASPAQVNAVTPDDDAEGDVTIQVTHPGGASNLFVMTKTRVSPVLQENPLFVAGDRKFIVAFQDNFASFVGPAALQIPGAVVRPARPGSVITIFALGLGSAATPAGQIPAGAPTVARDYAFRFGETVAEAIGVQAPGFVGLYQFNVTVPPLPPGDYPVELTVDGVPTGQGLYTSIAQP